MPARAKYCLCTSQNQYAPFQGRDNSTNIRKVVTNIFKKLRPKIDQKGVHQVPPWVSWGAGHCRVLGVRSVATPSGLGLGSGLYMSVVLFLLLIFIKENRSMRSNKFQHRICRWRFNRVAFQRHLPLRPMQYSMFSTVRPDRAFPLRNPPPTTSFHYSRPAARGWATGHLGGF